MKYDINNLILRLKNNEELTDYEYKLLINYEHNKLLLRSLNLINSNDEDYLQLYLMLGIMGQSLDGADYLPKACSYAISSGLINLYNYEQGLDDRKTASDILCRYNTLNYIKEVEEILKFDKIKSELENKLLEGASLGIDLFDKDDINSKIDDLSKTDKKIKRLTKNYFKN